MISGLFERLGGRPVIEQIVDGLYDRIDRDARLRPFFPRKRPEERQRQKLSFEELFGGEKRYSAAGFRHYGMQRRHLHKTITLEASAIWLEHFRASMLEAGVDAAVGEEVIASLRPAAYRLANPGASFQRLKGALKLAARGDLAGVHEALDAEPEMLNQRGHNGVTLLWEASRRGRLPLVEWLVERGARPDIPGACVDEASVLVTPLVIARKMGRADVAAYLEKHGARLDVFGASYLDDIDRVAAEVRADATVVSVTTQEEDFYPVTPLHYAVDGLAIQTAGFLIEKGAEVRAYSTRLLMLAARSGDLGLARLLLKGGADARVAEHLGPPSGGDVRIARLLIEHGLDINRRVSADRETFLTRATRGDKGEHPEAVRALLSLGADVNGRDAAGRTPLHNAARAGYEAVARILLANGADPSLRDKRGSTALELALAGRRRGVAVLLS